MSQTRSTATSSADQEEWGHVLEQLRADGFSPIESIKVTRAVLYVSLGEAKRIVPESHAWSDVRDVLPRPAHRRVPCSVKGFG